MILKGFFRQKRTKIYILIITILIFFSSLLFAVVDYLNIINNKMYLEISLFYIESDKDYYEQLLNDKDFINVHKSLKFGYSEGIIKQDDITEFELGNMVLVYADEENYYDLSDNDIIIVYNHNAYVNNVPYLSNYINKTLKFYYQDEEIKLKIKTIEEDNRSKVIISKSLFDKLNKINEINIYTLNFKTEKISDNFDNSNYFNDEDIILNLDIETDMNYRERLKSNLKIVQYATYGFIVIFILITIVVNKNIISDLKNNRILESRLGYSNLQIKINTFKRLSILHLLCYLIAIIVTIVIIISLNIFLDFKITFSNIIKISTLIIFILIGDLLLSLIVNNKSNTGERRRLI